MVGVGFWFLKKMQTKLGMAQVIGL
jgi:hypothetical protein